MRKAAFRESRRTCWNTSAKNQTVGTLGYPRWLVHKMLHSFGMKLPHVLCTPFHIAQCDGNKRHCGWHGIVFLFSKPQSLCMHWEWCLCTGLNTSASFYFNTRKPVTCTQQHQNFRPVWLNQILTPSINNGHSTLKSWCWAIYPFLAVFLFVLPTVSSVSRLFRTLSIRKNVAQQSDLFVAINVVCEQAISYAEHTENAAQQSDLFAAVNAVCWAYGKLCSVSRFFAA